MKPSEILKAILDLSAEDREKLLFYWDEGMRHEWDCNLPDGINLFSGGREMEVALKSALQTAQYNERRGA